MNVVTRVVWRSSMALLAVGVLCLLSAGAQADDGWIGEGGTPGLLKEHPAVTMTSEVVKLTVTDADVQVECNFVFTNSGPACSVRMGFPDYGSNEDEGLHNEGKPKPPTSHLSSFHSYIDGKPIHTDLIRSDKEEMHWQAKTVSFPAKGTLKIRDTYTVKIGGGVANIGSKGEITGSALNVGYILHTGASWHGPIGRAEVDITFHSKRLGDTLNLTPLASVATQKEPDNPFYVSKMVKGMVIAWKGPSKPTVREQTLSFVRSNFRPTEKDDVDVVFGYSNSAAWMAKDKK